MFQTHSNTILLLKIEAFMDNAHGSNLFQLSLVEAGHFTAQNPEELSGVGEGV